jgi:hypothetical protein
MLRGRAIASALLLALLPVAVAVADERLGEDEAARAALRFGSALMNDDISALKSLLPRRGKVRVRLDCLGPEQGSLSGEQLAALLSDFLRHGSLRSFDLVRSEAHEEQHALVQARARVIDREGAQRSVLLALTFHPESGRWILREIRESER